MGVNDSNITEHANYASSCVTIMTMQDLCMGGLFGAHTTLPLSGRLPHLYTLLHNDGVIAKAESTLQTGRACQLQ